ncbi:MAG: hypothetical protein ACD_15C00042G0003 [uncultured bacterium]|nr:MAG: hypothetical protein ACD_15C00042G0003 [uncultured bacterium]
MENENTSNESVSNESLKEKERLNKNRKILRIFEICFGIFLIIVLVFGGIFLKKIYDKNMKLVAENSALKTKKQASSSNNALSSNGGNNNYDSSGSRISQKKDLYIATLWEAEAILKGQMDWNNPKKIEDAGLFQSIDSYMNVGKVKSGKYSGYDFDIAKTIPDGPMGSMRISFLKKDNNYLILGRYGSFSTLDALRSYTNPDFEVDDDSISFTNDMIIEEIESPEFLYGPNKDQTLVKSYLIDDFSTDFLTVAFTDIKWGDVWMKDVEKVNKDKKKNKSSQISFTDNNSFYIKLPDGTAQSYALSFDKDKLLDITWKNDEKLEKEDRDKYDEAHRSGCGTRNVADVFMGSMNDLIVAGKNESGQDVYEYKNKDNQALKNIYDGAYWQDGSEKISYDKYVKDHPIIFVKDSFDRLLQFTTNKYPPAAECGKPVIYLYPQEKTNVDVEVFPIGGMIVSDPAYQKGWSVIADPSGEITNLADNKIYPYLFWEGRGNIVAQASKTGFIVEKNNLDEFLSEKLTQAGLIEKEIGDFKDFWLPRMIAGNKPYYFVTFMGNNYMDKIASLNIHPRPDSVIRILMDYEGLDDAIDVQPEILKTPERKGFTVVEWGGVLRK